MHGRLSKPVFAKKSFGQNFLVDEHYIGRIIDAVGPEAGEHVLEIGPGRGALTEALLESGARVTAIEIERDMIAFLHEKFGDHPMFTLVEADALKVDFTELAAAEGRLRLVANLPYYISTAILQKLIDQRASFSEMILMFQREVVERITAGVGNGERGFLSVMTENYLNAEKLFDVPPKAFRPSPKVWSSIVRLSTRDAEEPETDAYKTLFRAVVSRAFAQKRKTILNNFKNAPEISANRDGEAAEWLAAAGIEASRRAESLTIGEWRRLVGLLKT